MRVEISFIDEPLELLNDTIRRASFASVELVRRYFVADVGVNSKTQTAQMNVLKDLKDVLKIVKFNLVLDCAFVIYS